MKGLRTGGRVKSIGGSETVGAVGVGTVGNATGGVVLGRTKGATEDGRLCEGATLKMISAQPQSLSTCSINGVQKMLGMSCRKPPSSTSLHV